MWSPSLGMTPEELEARARECARTVPQLFGLLAAHVEDAEGFDAEYDPALGYPTRILIDPDARVADDEIDVEILDLMTEGRP